MTSMPAAGLPVVPFFAVPWTVPACTPTDCDNARQTRSVHRLTQPLMARSDGLAWDALHGGAALAIPSPDQFLQAPTPLPFRSQISSFRSRLQNICPNDIQIAGRGDCRKSCRGAQATDPALTGGGQDPSRRAEYKKSKPKSQR